MAKKGKRTPGSTQVLKTEDDEEFEVTYGTGNVFADIGLPEPDKYLARSSLMSLVTDIIKERDLTQTEAAKLLGLSQGRVWDLLNGKLDKFSLDKLIRILNALDHKVQIVVEPSKSKKDVALIEVLRGTEVA